MTWYISVHGNDTENCGRSPAQPCKSLPYLLEDINPAQSNWTRKVYGIMKNITEIYEEKKKNWTEDILNGIEENRGIHGKCLDFTVDTSALEDFCKEIKLLVVPILDEMSTEGRYEYMYQLTEACTRSGEVYVSLIYDFCQTCPNHERTKGKDILDKVLNSSLSILYEIPINAIVDSDIYIENAVILPILSQYEKL